MPTTKFQPRYTQDDYSQWSGDWELWSGLAVAMTPSPFGHHQLIVVNSVAELHPQLRGTNYHVLAELDWIVSSDTIVRPDVMIIAGSVPDRHQTVPPIVAIEVLSDSTRTKDQIAKFELYQENGVRYYIMIDSETKSVECYRLDNGRYQQLDVVTDSIKLSLAEDKVITLPINNLFT